MTRAAQEKINARAARAAKARAAELASLARVAQDRATAGHLDSAAKLQTFKAGWLKLR